MNKHYNPEAEPWENFVIQREAIQQAIYETQMTDSIIKKITPMIQQMVRQEIAGMNITVDIQNVNFDGIKSDVRIKGGK